MTFSGRVGFGFLEVNERVGVINERRSPYSVRRTESQSPHNYQTTYLDLKVDRRFDALCDTIRGLELLKITKGA